MNHDISLKEQLYNYLKKNEGQWFKKVHLFVLSDELGYSPENAGRRLRELANEGKIQVGYYDGKYAPHQTKYSYNPPADLKPKVEIINNTAILSYA